jgi:hypothetical protein
VLVSPQGCFRAILLVGRCRRRWLPECLVVYHVEFDGLGDKLFADVAHVDLEFVCEDAFAELVGQLKGVFHGEG